MRSCRGVMAAAGAGFRAGGAAKAGATVSAIIKSRRATDRRQGILLIVALGENGLVSWRGSGSSMHRLGRRTERIDD